MTNEAQMQIQGENITGTISFNVNDGRVTEVLGVEVRLSNRKFNFDAVGKLISIRDAGLFPSLYNVSEKELERVRTFAEQSLAGFKSIHINRS